jgi:hypothetical protein
VFKQNLRNAAIKLCRAKANDGIDPVSGYTQQDILDYIVSLPTVGSDEVQQVTAAKAMLRRLGFTKEADTLFA